MTSPAYDGKLTPWVRIRTRAFQLAAAFVIAGAVWSCDQGDTPPPATGAASDAPEQGTAEELSQEDLEATYATLTGLTAEARTEEVWKRFGAQQAAVSVVDNRLIVNATGDNPTLTLPPFVTGTRFIMQVVINSPVETVAQVYYLRKGQTKYKESQSQVAGLSPGRNVIYFRLDAPDLIDPVRFDPAEAPGEYIIESMTAMGLP